MKLTDEQLTRLAAIKVMGCAGFGPDWELIREWSPLADWRAAGEIVGKMRSLGWQSMICSAAENGNLMVDFFRRRPHEDPLHEESDSFPRAITIAALLAVGGITEDQL